MSTRNRRRTTFHLVTADVRAVAEARLVEGDAYAASSLEDEGFIHCTDGVDALGITFDRFYATDPRVFVALTVDLDALSVPWRYDVPGSPYPHIHGPIVRSAILGANRVERRPDGRFNGLGPV